MMNRDEIFEKTLRRMPAEFSSIEFYRAATQLGMSERDRVNNKPAPFLMKNALRITKRTWRKKDSAVNTPLKPSIPDVKESEAVDLLKSLGYKVLKPTFTEV
jgi:hypothetical protein